MKNLAFLLLLPLAHAHMPGEADLDTTVEDPLISWALDGEFHEGDEVFVIRLPLSGGLAIPFELLVPLIIFESVLRQVYYSSGPVGLPLGTGETQVWIWSPDGEPGPWVLGFGVEEGFGGDS